ncbi:MAG: hypothetical protein ACOVMM_06680 [Chitinophagaceae bacterium]
MEKEFNPHESLQLIQGMINKAQNKFADNSFLYLLWGWVVFGCALFQYVVVKFKIDVITHPEWVWFSTIGASIYQFIFLAKLEKNSLASTYTDELIKYSWIVFGISMTLISFVISKANAWNLAYPIIFVMYGIPTFLCGVIMKFNPLKIGAICCWIIAIVGTFVSSLELLLLLALAMVTTWIIPGYLLRKKFKTAN